MSSRKAMLIVIICAIAVVVAWPSRYRIEASIWHWRHHGILELTPYSIHVPSGWLVETGESSATAIKLRSLFGRKEVVSPTAGFSSLNTGTRELSRWKAARVDLLSGAKIMEQQFQIDDEQVICIGTTSSTQIIDLECMSTGSLNIRLIGHTSDLNELYSIVRSIHKKK